MPDTTANFEPSSRDIAKYANRLSAMGTEPRLRILRLLLSAHPTGLVVTEIQLELDMPGSSLSHHLEKLRIVDLVNVKREGTFLRYTANVEGLRELLIFLFAECCTRNQVVPLAGFADICGTGLSVLNESCCPPTGGSGT